MYDKLWILKDSHFGKILIIFAYIISELYNCLCLCVKSVYRKQFNDS